jgi:hypothetical protein
MTDMKIKRWESYFITSLFTFGLYAAYKAYRPIRHLIDPYYPEFYFPQFAYGSEINRLYYYLRFQKNFFKQQIASGDILILGTFQQDSPEVEKMWCHIEYNSKYKLKKNHH